MPVYADEAYYYVWSQHPQLSYFDHPAMVSWLISLGHLFFSFADTPLTSSLVLRSFFILISSLTLVVWNQILEKKNFSSNQQVLFFTLFLLNPLLGPGSIIATPDVPLVFFWSLSYLCFLHVVEKPTLKWSAFLGASLGLAFCSKYHIVLFVISGLIYLAVSKKIKTLSVLGVLTTIIFGFIFSLPVVYWNFKNDWVSFRFQLNHGLGRIDYDWLWTISFILGQILISGPLVFKEFIKNRSRDSSFVFGATQLLFFCFSSFKGVVEANWPITSHMHTNETISKNISSTQTRKVIYYWAVVYTLALVVFFTPLQKELLKNQINSHQVRQLQPFFEKYSPIYGPTYQISSLLTWLQKKEIYKLNSLSRIDFFDSLEQSNPKVSTFYTFKRLDAGWPEKYDSYVKTRIETIDQLEIEFYKVSNE